MNLEAIRALNAEGIQGLSDDDLRSAIKTLTEHLSAQLEEDDYDGEQWDKDHKQLDALNEDLQRRENDTKRDADRRAALGDVKKDLGRSTGRRAKPDQLRVTVKDNFEDDPKKGFKTPREFLMDVMSVGLGRSQPDDRLKFLAAGSDEHGEYSDPSAGFLIPEGFSPSLLQISAEDDPVAGRTTSVPMQTPKLGIPARVDENHATSVSGGLVVSRSAETAAKTASRMKTRKVNLEAFSLFGFSYATNELLTDSPMTFAALLAAGFSEEFTNAILAERLNGNGVGEYLGARQSPAKITVAKEAGQANGTIVAQNVYKVRSRVWRYQNAMWMGNHDILPQLCQLNDGTNNIWLPSAREDAPDLLLGRPIVFTEHLPGVGNEADLGCYNWTQFLEGTLQPLQSAESMHVRFVNHEQVFKFWLRNAGAPWWKAALQPKNGSTLSPFVVLGARQ